jgi:glycosyltransferase involved in cell wall biosynthesis
VVKIYDIQNVVANEIETPPEQPALTVLMPAYNAAAYINAAIDSICSQTYANFEFIIIDDCSSDSTVDIISGYNDPRIRFYQNDTNIGIAATLNKGILLASTDIIARMDADDISYPGRLAYQLQYLAENPHLALLSGGARIINESGHPLHFDKFDGRHYAYNLNFVCLIYHPTVIFKRQAAIKAGLYSEQYSEDFDLWWKISRDNLIGHHTEVILDYRLTSVNTSLVTKRKEYDLAQHLQVLRNIHYYTGENFKVSFAEIESFRNNFEPLLLQNDISKVVTCIRTLRHITMCMSTRTNPNLDKQAIHEAFDNKRHFILASVRHQFKGMRYISFWLQTGLWKNTITRRIPKYFSQQRLSAS